MSLEEARAALLAEILGEDIATANQGKLKQKTG